MSSPTPSPKDLSRINTSFAGLTGRSLRSGGSGRLSLHIPNSYPRSTTPRSRPSSIGSSAVSSRSPSPNASSGPPSPGPSSSPSQPSKSVFGWLKGDRPPSTQESNHDDHQPGPSNRGRPRQGSPLIKVFRRDSSLITIQHIDDNGNDNGNFTSSGSRRSSDYASANTAVHMRSKLLRQVVALRRFFSTRTTSSSSARDFLARERNFFVWLRLSCFLAILSASLVLQLQLPAQAHSTTRQPRRRPSNDPIPVAWDKIPLASKAFAGVFFILSLLALGTGLADYLHAERQLEKEQVDFDETEGVFLNDGHTPTFVHAVMLVIGAGVAASALWLIAV